MIPILIRNRNDPVRVFFYGVLHEDGNHYDFGNPTSERIAGIFSGEVKPHFQFSVSGFNSADWEMIKLTRIV